jgi:hypothetical protein
VQRIVTALLDRRSMTRRLNPRPPITVAAFSRRHFHLIVTIRLRSVRRIALIAHHL